MWVLPRDYKVVGSALAAARRSANLTQVELAARLRKPQSFVSDYERGQRRVDIPEFVVITRTLGAEPLHILAEILATLPKSARARM
jgi:transcriptional regulator with XRE-family HTH domain